MIPFMEAIELSQIVLTQIFVPKVAYLTAKAGAPLQDCSPIQPWNV